MENREIKIKSDQGDYSIYVEKDLTENIEDLLKALAPKKRVFLLSDINVFPTFGINLMKSLEGNSIACESLSLNLNEKNKNLETVSLIYNWLVNQRVERSDILISLGGGVATDLIGFAASTWLRGIKIIHFPTTLAAMVDASVGGKTAVNLSKGKNLIGAFHQPKGIFMDTSTLMSLPKRELNSGWAEAIKHAFLFDPLLLELFTKNKISINLMKEPIFTQVVKRSVEIKGNIVSKDEYETGTERIRLNFGHTIAHALEAATKYTQLLHGEAVSIGMVIASKISNKLGICNDSIPEMIIKTLELYDLPTKIPKNINIEKLYEICKTDKKVQDGKIKWVLIEDIGKSVIRNNVEDKIVIEVLTKNQ